MQILKAFNKDLISEVALQCGDSQFVDFPETIYAQAAFRAQREVAKDYNILQREITLTTETDTWEDLNLSNFVAEAYVKVNDTKYDKRNELDDADALQYHIRFDNYQWQLNYTNKVAGDEVNIFYTLTGDVSEEQDGTPIIPDKYYEEVVNKAVIYIAKLGIAQHEGVKLQKYQNVFRINQRQKIDSSLAKDNSWISIKPFIYP